MTWEPDDALIEKGWNAARQALKDGAANQQVIRAVLVAVYPEMMARALVDDLEARISRLVSEETQP